MLFPELFKQLEAVRWNMERDIPWSSFDASKLSDEQAQTIKMNATVGFININQNRIIKIFSVASVALLPPTLIASIYGMNFKVMPEMNWDYGYPFALVLMASSMIAPFWYFRRKGWL